MRRGTNLDRVGEFNDAVVLAAIRRAEERLSRVELAAATGLSGQAISNITRRLLDAGLVREAGRLRGAGLGKPRTLLELEPTGQYAVGVHLDPSVVTVVVLDLTGQVVARRRTETPAADDPDVLIDGIANTIESLIAEADVPRQRVVGVGIAAPGPIDVERGVVVDPPNLAAWHLVPLRDALRERTGLPVLLDKDGPLCYCGRRGCVGETSQPRYLVQQAVQAGVLAQGIDLDDRHAVDVAFTTLCTAAGQGPGVAREILTALAERIAKVVEDIANLLDLDRVVFGGPLWDRLAPYFDEPIRAALAERFLVRSVHPLQVAGTSLGVDVGAVGAASLVLDHTFSPNPSVLLPGPAQLGTWKVTS